MSESVIPCGVFELEEPIGSGRAGKVWRGRHSVEGLPVAVKVLTTSAIESWDKRRFIKRSFEKEIEAATKLNHPGVIRVFEFGRTSAETERRSEGGIAEGLPYIAMEYTDDGALDDQPPFTRWEDLKELLFQLLSALAYAHSREVLHRDLKPPNVLVFRNVDEPAGIATPTYKLTDFGLAHAAHGEEELQTKDVFAIGGGTPTYMAPEQLKEDWRSFGPWTDLYALGCMVYKLASGRPPFMANNPASIMFKQMEEEPPPLTANFPVPGRFQDWLRRTIAKDPADRFECAADAAYALALCFEGTGSGNGNHTLSGGFSSVDNPEDSGAPNANDGTRPLHADSDQNQMPNSPGTTNVLQTIVETGMFGRGSEKETIDAFEPPPPIPGNWYVELPPLPEPQILGAGLGLLGEREVPLVDRADERDQIWDKFTECHTERGTSTVLFTGATGVGKTRLGIWTAHRLEELGLSRSLVCDHPRDSLNFNTLPRCIERFFGTWNLEKTDIAEQISDRLQTMLGVDVGTNLQQEVIQFATLANANKRREPDAEHSSEQLSKDERFEFFATLLERLSTNRTPVLFFDDVHRSREALEFIAYLDQKDDSPPCFIIATVDDDSLVDESDAAARLETIRQRPSVAEICISPLPLEHTERVLNYLLKFDSESRNEIVEVAAGNPLVVVETVRNLVKNGGIENSPDGYRLAVDEAGWSDRLTERLEGAVHALYKSIPPAHRPQFRRALEATVLSNRGKEAWFPRKWDDCCEWFGITDSAAAGELLNRREMIVETEDGWRFRHRVHKKAIEMHAESDPCVSAAVFYATGRSVQRGFYFERSLRCFDGACDPLRAADDRTDRFEILLDMARAESALQLDRINEARSRLERIQERLDDASAPNLDVETRRKIALGDANRYEGAYEPALERYGEAVRRVNANSETIPEERLRELGLKQGLAHLGLGRSGEATDFLKRVADVTETDSHPLVVATAQLALKSDLDGTSRTNELDGAIRQLEELTMGDGTSQSDARCFRDFEGVVERLRSRVTDREDDAESSIEGLEKIVGVSETLRERTEG